jgi:hypothetical protein
LEGGVVTSSETTGPVVVDADSDVEELPAVEPTRDADEFEGSPPHAATLINIAEISTSCRRIFTPNPQSQPYSRARIIHSAARNVKQQI